MRLRQKWLNGVFASAFKMCRGTFYLFFWSSKIITFLGPWTLFFRSLSWKIWHWFKKCKIRVQRNKSVTFSEWKVLSKFTSSRKLSVIERNLADKNLTFYLFLCREVFDIFSQEFQLFFGLWAYFFGAWAEKISTFFFKV